MPTTSHHDVIIVGARAAGAATALQLARRGMRVLVIDRDRHGADTLSTHALQRVAVMLLDEWGLLESLRRRGTPAVRDVTFHYRGHEPMSIPLREPLYAPRRTVLDPVLIDAAIAAGADVRRRTSLRQLVRDQDGRVLGIRATGPDGAEFEARAPITVGADGRRSSVAAAVDARITHAGRTAGTYAYTRVRCDVPSGYRWLFGEGVSAGVIPTNDGLATVFVGTGSERFDEVRRDVPGWLRATLTDLEPELAATVLEGEQVGPVRCFTGQPARLRRPHGPGWALVGDAGSFKDPISSHGITDALKDSVLLVDAIDDAKHGTPDGLAYATYEARRDALTMPLLAAVEPITTYSLSIDELMSQHLELSAAMKHEASTFRAQLAARRPTRDDTPALDDARACELVSR